MSALHKALLFSLLVASTPLLPACSSDDPSEASGCAEACGANATCQTSTKACVCIPGFISQGGACVAAPPGDPSTRAEAEVCAAWKQGHVEQEPEPVSASGEQCDAGALKSGALLDTLARLNMFRWLAGLGPTTNDAALDAAAQKCANLEAWWDFSKPENPHAPPPGSTCYTEEGAQTAGQSNIAWGSGTPANAMDQFMTDEGNDATMGHRRWLVNPPLGPVGIGFWEPGGMYGNAMCLRVFGAQGSGPKPPWVAVPNPGYVPLEMAQWTWTFHGSLEGLASAQVAMARVDDGAPLELTTTQLQQGFGQDAISWRPAGWTVEAGKTYRVTISGLADGDVSYEVKPVACN